MEGTITLKEMNKQCYPKTLTLGPKAVTKLQHIMLHSSSQFWHKETAQKDLDELMTLIFEESGISFEVFT